MPATEANSRPDGPAWQRGLNWRLRGQLLRDDRLLSAAELDAALPDLRTPQALGQWLRGCSGSYALLFRQDGDRKSVV